jgi:hypothetical protein
MAGMSDYLENALLSHLFRNSTFTRPANIYIALYTAAPGEAGGGTEVSGGSYARQAVATGASSGWLNPTAGATENSATITFPTATADWGTVVAVGLFDQLTGGNLLFFNSLTANKIVQNGDSFRFNASDLRILLD